MTIDLEKLRPIFEDAVAIGVVAAAKKHGILKSYVQSSMSLARKIGAAPPAARGHARKYDPAEVVAALRVKPIGEVAAQFGVLPATLLKIDAEARKAAKATSGAGESVQQIAA